MPLAGLVGAADGGAGRDAARRCSRRPGRAARRTRIRGADARQQFLDSSRRRRRLRLRRLLRRSRRAKPEIKEQTKATIRVLPDEEFRSPEAPDDLHVVRQAERGGGGLGEGVLSRVGTAADRRRALFDARLERPAGAPVRRRAADRHRRRRRHAGLRLQRGRHPRPLPGAGRGARAGAAPDLLLGQGQRQPRGAPGAARPGRRAPTSSPAASCAARSRPASSRERIVFSGVGKTADELEAAVDAGIGHVNVESIAELAALGADRGAASDVAGAGRHPGQSGRHRRHPPVHRHRRRAASSSAFRSTRWCRWPRPIGEHPLLDARRASRCTSGASSSMPTPVRRGDRRGCSIWSRGLREAGVGTIASLDIGGGLGIRYRDEQPLEPRRAGVDAIAPAGAAQRARRSSSSRAATWSGSAGVLLTTVLYRKHSGGKDLVIVDAGMNDLVRPSHYKAYHEIVAVERRRPAGARRWTWSGPICETGDFLALRPHAARRSSRGELLAVLGAGAYGFVMSSNYNTRPRPRRGAGGRGALVPVVAAAGDGRDLIAASSSTVHTEEARDAPRTRILILDYGSQFTQLIARRVREAHVYCEIHPPTRARSQWIREWSPKGIILSGGPNSVYDEGAPTADPELLRPRHPGARPLLRHAAHGPPRRRQGRPRRPPGVRPRQRHGGRADGSSAGSDRARRPRSG